MFRLKNDSLVPQPTLKRKQATDGYSEILKEAYEYFHNNNIDMIYGFNEILCDPSLFQEYCQRLTEGSDEYESEECTQLFENNKATVLQEAAFEQIAPLQALSMPVIKKMWARTALKNAIPTEIAKLPTFVIAYEVPYIKGTDGVKHFLPDAVYGTNDRVEKPKLFNGYILMSDIATAGKGNLMDLTVIGGVAASPQFNDQIDTQLYLEYIKVEVPNDTTTELKEIKILNKMSMDGKFYVPVSTMSAHALPADRVPVTDTLHGHLDCVTGDFTMISIKGLVKEVKFLGWLTQDANTRVETVGFDIKKREVTIGHGAHLDAPIPIEFLQDAMALYQIDGTVKIIDYMSNIMSQKIDSKIRDFLVQSFDKSYAAGGFAYEGSFDVRPSAGFAGTPTQWRDELKTMIEWFANKLKHHTKFIQGYFVVIGNPLDVQLISDIDWQFTGANAQKGGVNIDYNVGVLTSHNNFNFISSDNMEQGKLRMIFCPNVGDYMTYKYYPYTFNIQKDYRSSAMPNVPNIMMTKRDTVEEFIPMQIVINIEHNDGSYPTSYALH